MSDGMNKQAEILKSLSFFKDFSEEELFKILSSASWSKYKPYDPIIEEGTEGSTLYIIIKGSVRILKTTQSGEKQFLAVLYEGECFGEMSLISGKKRVAHVVADEEAFILKMTSEALIAMDKDIQLKFYKTFCNFLIDRLSRADVYLTTPQKQ